MRYFHSRNLSIVARFKWNYDIQARIPLGNQAEKARKTGSEAAHFCALGIGAAFATVMAVIRFLKFVGMTNAAVWLGAAVFLALGVEPGVFSTETLGFLKKPFYDYFSVVMDGIIRTHFLYFSLKVCGVVALMHLMAEWLYLGRRVPRPSLSLVIGLIALVLLNCLWLQSHLFGLHEARFKTQTSRPAAQQGLQQSFDRWQRVSMAGDALMIGGLAFYLWRVAREDDPLRFVGSSSRAAMVEDVSVGAFGHHQDTSARLCRWGCPNPPVPAPTAITWLTKPDCR